MLLSSHMYTAALRGKISDIVFGMSVPGLQILKGNYSSISHGVRACPKHFETIVAIYACPLPGKLTSTYGNNFLCVFGT